MTVILQQVLEAAACIHEHNLVHRDIAPHNIWIMTRSPLFCKLLGFHSKTNFAHRAPEISARESYIDNDYPADIWSIGLIVLQYSLFGTWHVPARSIEQHLENQRSRPDPIWQKLTSLANAMVDFDASKRPSAEQCLEMIGSQCEESCAIADTEQLFNNLQFLSSQEIIPGVPAALRPLLADVRWETQLTVDATLAWNILEIPQTIRKAAKRLPLHRLAAPLVSLSSMEAQCNAIYVGNIEEQVKNVHLAKLSRDVAIR